LLRVWLRNMIDVIWVTKRTQECRHPETIASYRVDVRWYA